MKIPVVGSLVRVLLIAVALHCIAVVPAFAEKHTGRDFLIFCASPRLEAEVNCSVIVDGVVNGYFMANPSPPSSTFCIPATVTVGQLKAVATKYLLQHLELHHRTFADTVVRSMVEAFPCRQFAPNGT